VSQERPLVSIFMFVRNGEASIRRAIESVRAQTYPNIEFVVQDGASTDATLDILRSYGDIEVVSEPDSGPNEGLWRALNLCNGEFIGSCLADEELLPDAVAHAVRALQCNPDAGAVTGDAIITDLPGEQTGFWRSAPFNLVDYLCCDYTPYFVSSFFRRQALLDAGLKTDKWGTDCVEFELWCRLSARHRVMYLPETIAKYASHPGQSSSNARDVVVHFTGRLNMIVTMCDGGGLLGADPLMRAFFIWGHARAFINHALGIERTQIAEALYKVTRETMARFPPVELDGIPYDESYAFRRSADAAWSNLEKRIPGFIRRLIGSARMETWGARVRSRLVASRQELPAADLTLGNALRLAFSVHSAPVPSRQIVLPPPPSSVVKAKLYAQLALRYEAEGRAAEALEIWRAAALLAGLRAATPSEERQRMGYTPVSR
jgi:glycosyltransferase involved in cell wall biosynthesis